MSFYRVSARCLQEARDLRMNRPDELPSEVDFAKLSEGLQLNLKQRLEELGKQKDRTTWRNLAEAVQVEVLHIKKIELYHPRPLNLIFPKYEQFFSGLPDRL